MTRYETDEVSLPIPAGWTPLETGEDALVWGAPDGTAELWLWLFRTERQQNAGTGDFHQPEGATIDPNGLVAQLFEANAAGIASALGSTPTRSDETSSSTLDVYSRQVRFDGASGQPITFLRVQTTNALFRGQGVIATVRFLVLDPTAPQHVALASQVLDGLVVFPGFLRSAGLRASTSIDPARVYPLLVPVSRLQHPADAPSIGHGLHVSLAIAGDGVAEILLPHDVRARGVDPESLQEPALANLEALMIDGTIRIARVGRDTVRFLAVHDHWLAASALLLPSLRAFAMEALSTERVLACASTRTDLLLFRADDAAVRKEVLGIATEQSREDPKPLSTGLFELTPDGPRALETTR